MPWLPEDGLSAGLSDKRHQAGEGWPLTHRRAGTGLRGFLASAPGLSGQYGAGEDL